MKNPSRRFGFTLMEVNLAIFIMAAGVLAMISLYPLGYRENEQSKQDVMSAITADATLNPLVAALSSRNITWENWKQAVGNAVNRTDKGWLSYCEKKNNAYTPLNKSQLNAKAQTVFSALANAYQSGGKPTWPSKNNDFACALVAQWGRMRVLESVTGDGPVIRQREDYSRCALSFRCAHNAGSLFASPIYYTEVHFQGDQKELQ